MRKIFLFLSLLIFGGLLQAAAQTAQSVTVKLREQKTIGNKVSIKFAEMLGDSRCPADVRCVWAGNAKMKIALSRPGELKIFELNTGMKPQSIVFGGYEIKVVALEPRVKTNARINTDAYIATFNVTRTK